MRRDRALVAFLCLLIILTANPSMSSIPAAIVDEHPEAMFSTAADGDESSESITSFSETSADDAMQGMECDDVLEQYRHDEISYFDDGADAARWTNGVSGGWPVDAFSSDGATLYVDANVTDSDGPGHSFVESLHNDEMAGDGIEMMGAHLYVQFKWLDNLSTSYSGYILIRARNSWENHYEGIVNVSSYAENTWHTVDVGPVTWQAAFASGATYRQYNNILISFLLAEPDYSSIRYQLWLNYTVIAYPDLSYEADSDTYAESFADVSDWTQQTGEDWGTDSDRMYVDVAKDAVYDAYYTNSPSITNGKSYYYEIRLQNNITDLYKMNVVIRWYSQDSMGGTYGQTGNLATTSTDQTFKGIITSDQAIECIYVLFYVAASASGPNRFYVDYLRIGESDEMGWQHDGSTVAGVTADNDAHFDYVFSSDGDILNITTTVDTGSSNNGDALLVYDTTATAADLEDSDYPFFEMNYKCAVDGGNYYVYTRYGGKTTTVQLTTDNAWRTFRLNIAAGTSTGSANILFRYYRSVVGQTAHLLMNWSKAFSIANHTVTQSGAGTDDYLYVDSGVLYSHVDDGYIELNHDPALSVSDTYSVYNLTTSGTAPQFSQYVSSWSTYSDETRGATTSGTVTDIKLKFDSTETLSAIKFIEDGTAPAVVRSSSTPNDPSDDEGVMLTAVVTDAVEVYKVYFDAIVSPAGFSDVPYYATEQTDNLWTYEFATLPTGPYVFKIMATDGANENALTEYAYIELTVREAAIIINPITFLGAGNDFEDVTMSFECNRDGSYVVREWTQSDGSDAANTWTGTVIDGWNNIAWDKLTTDSEAVYFNFTITSGSLSWVYENQYQVAQNTFYLSTASQVEGLDAVTVAGRISKLGAWQLYDENDEFKDSGSITDLDFTIRFTKWSGYDEQDHDFAIKFTNGSQSCWYNSSFYAFKKPAVAAVVTTDPNILYAYHASFWTAIGIGAVIVMLAIDLYRKWK